MHGPASRRTATTAPNRLGLWAGQFGKPTSLSPHVLRFSRIIQLALVARDAQGETLWEREWCVCDAPPCQSRASRYHGLEDERLRSDGLPIAVVLTYLLDAMRLLCHDKGRLVSHNLEFDGGTLLGEYRRLALASTTHEPLEYPDPSACCPNSPLSVRGGGEIYTYTYSCSLLTASNCPLGATDQWTEASNLLAQLASAGACTFAMYAPLDHTVRHTYTCIP